MEKCHAEFPENWARKKIPGFPVIQRPMRKWVVNANLHASPVTD